MNSKDEERKRARELAQQFADKGDVTGWFEQLYREGAAGETTIPWADMEPNRFLKAYAEKTGLKGNGRTALVVGCGLGDDAVYLSDLGFKVTAFDISQTAVDWASRLHADKGIDFKAADLLNAPEEWNGAFEFVLEIYTIQPLPLEIRSAVIDAIAKFVAPGGELLIVTKSRGDDEQPDKLPWPVSRRELRRFEENGLVQIFFEVVPSDDEDPDRFVVTYRRPK